MAERNVCMEAFDRLCADVNTDKKSAIDQQDYWLFELGFRSAIEELLNIADAGEQSREAAPGVVLGLLPGEGFQERQHGLLSVDLKRVMDSRSSLHQTRSGAGNDRA